ncbi:hypothetical protein ATER59S_05809 [Aquamicrobium terrae]
MGKHDPISLEKRITITKDQVKAWAQAAEAEISEAEKNCQLSDALMKSYKEQQVQLCFAPGVMVAPGFLRPTAFMELVRTVGYYSSAAAWLFYFYPIHEVGAAYSSAEPQEKSLQRRACRRCFHPARQGREGRRRLPPVR